MFTHHYMLYFDLEISIEKTINIVYLPFTLKVVIPISSKIHNKISNRTHYVLLNTFFQRIFFTPQSETYSNAENSLIWEYNKFMYENNL